MLHVWFILWFFFFLVSNLSRLSSLKKTGCWTDLDRFYKKLQLPKIKRSKSLCAETGITEWQ